MKDEKFTATSKKPNSFKNVFFVLAVVNIGTCLVHLQYEQYIWAGFAGVMALLCAKWWSEGRG